MNEDNQSEDTAPEVEAEQPAEHSLEGAELLQEQLKEARREKDQFRAMAQRSQAEMVNYRRRLDEEQKQFRLNANADLMEKFLDVVDDFSRAIEMLPADADAGWGEGLFLVQRNLLSVLKSENVIKIEAEGKVFDPWEHQAIAYQETADAEDGTVIQVVREGYKLNSRVLRASRVVVAKSPSAEQTESQTQSNEQES